MKRSKDYLINVGLANFHYLIIVGLVSVTGLFYSFQLLPAYDPSTLAQPMSLVMVEYTSFWIGGLIVILSLIWSRWDKVVSLKIQYAGLMIQTTGIICAVLTAVAYSWIKFGTPKAALFIMLWGTAFGIAHINHLFYVRRESINAPIKRSLGEQTAPIVEEYGAGHDLILQTLRGQQHKIDELQARLEGRS